MKRLLLFCFFAFLTLSIRAQDPVIKKINARFIDNEWVNYTQEEYEFDSQGRELAKRRYLFDEEHNIPNLYSEVDRFYSDDTSIYVVTRNLRSVETAEGDLNVWEEDIYEYEYDQNKNKIYNRRETTQFFPDGSTEKTYGRIFSYTYTADNCKIQEVFSLYRPSADIDEWANFYKYDYIVDGNCLNRSKTEYVWRYNNWESSVKYQYIYNEDGLLINEKRFEIDGSSLNLDREYSKSYFPDGRLAQYTTNDPNTKRQDRIDYSYEDGFVTEFRYDSYDNGETWILSSTVSEKRDEYGSLWYSFMTYDSDGELFVETHYTYEYEFNDQEQVIWRRSVAQEYVYSELTRDVSGITTYTYRCDGLLKETTTIAENTNLDPCGASNNNPFKKTYFYAEEAPCATEQPDIKINIFPNPAQNYILAESTLLGLPDTKVLLIDNSGKVVYDYDAYTTHKHKIHTAHLHSGLYYLRVQNKEQQFVEPILIAR